jgi:hypothetical protein
MKLRTLFSGLPKRLYIMIETLAAAVFVALKKRAPKILTEIVGKLVNSNEKKDQWAGEILDTRSALEATLGKFTALVSSGAVTINENGIIAVAMMKSSAESDLDRLAHIANKIADSKFDVAKVIEEGANIEIARFRETVEALRGVAVKEPLPIVPAADPLADAGLR